MLWVLGYGVWRQFQVTVRFIGRGNRRKPPCHKSLKNLRVEIRVMVFNATFYNVLARSWQVSFIGGWNRGKLPTCVYNHFHRYFSYIVVVSFIGGWSGGNHWTAASRPIYSTCLTNAHGDVQLVVITSRSFNDSSFSTGFVTWITRQVLIVQQELPTFPDNISSLHDSSGTYEFWLLLWYPQKFFVLTFIVTMDSGRIPAYFIYQLKIIAMQLVQEEGLVNRNICWFATVVSCYVRCSPCRLANVVSCYIKRSSCRLAAVVLCYVRRNSCRLPTVVSCYVRCSPCRLDTVLSCYIRCSRCWRATMVWHHVTSGVALFDLLLWYHVTSDIFLVDLILCYHVTSGVALVDVLLWYHVTSGVALGDLLLRYYIKSGVALVNVLLWHHLTWGLALVDLLLWYHVTSGVALFDLLLWYHVTTGITLVD
jgi:hypothetical protein